MDADFACEMQAQELCDASVQGELDEAVFDDAFFLRLAGNFDYGIQRGCAGLSSAEA